MSDSIVFGGQEFIFDQSGGAYYPDYIGLVGWAATKKCEQDFMKTKAACQETHEYS